MLAKELPHSSKEIFLTSIDMCASILNCRVGEELCKSSVASAVSDLKFRAVGMISGLDLDVSCLDIICYKEDLRVPKPLRQAEVQGAQNYGQKYRLVSP